MIPNYFSTLPVDPLNTTDAIGPTSLLLGPRRIASSGKTYVYSYVGTSRNFSLIARLESSSDSSRCGIQNYSIYSNSGFSYTCTSTGFMDILVLSNTNVADLYILSR